MSKELSSFAAEIVGFMNFLQNRGLNQQHRVPWVLLLLLLAPVLRSGFSPYKQNGRKFGVDFIFPTGLLACLVFLNPGLFPRRSSLMPCQSAPDEEGIQMSLAKKTWKNPTSGCMVNEMVIKPRDPPLWSFTWTNGWRCLSSHFVCWPLKSN